MTSQKVGFASLNRACDGLWRSVCCFFFYDETTPMSYFIDFKFNEMNKSNSFEHLFNNRFQKKNAANAFGKSLPVK